MGWASQGFFRNYNFEKQDFNSPCWIVNCSGEEDFRVEEFSERGVDLNGWENKVKIFYGTSGSLFFKGYVESDDLMIVKSVLDHFNGFLVYENKYGGLKALDTDELVYFSINNFTLFIEERRYSMEEIDMLIEDLEAYILPNHLDQSGKEKIKQEIKNCYHHFN